MRALFTANDREMTDAMAGRLFDVLAAAGAENAGALRDRGRVLNGVLTALSALMSMPIIVQSVLTGNILPNAQVKLGAFGLDAYMDFEVGGYGSDDIVRANLVSVAQRKARTKYGVDFDATSTLLVGDTTRDVEAGTKGGALVLGVATGKTSMRELQTSGAHAVLPDLADHDRFINAVTHLLPELMAES